jgi:hypothetical protein
VELESSLLKASEDAVASISRKELHLVRLLRQ